MIFPKKQTNFVIVTIPRSGSNYLCGILNSHPEVLCHHELYHKSAIYYSLDHRTDLDLGTPTQRDLRPNDFLESVWQHSFSAQAVGFKIFPDHNDEVLERILKDENIKKIILDRPNLLRVFVSNEIAKRTGIFSSLQGQAQPVESITVDFTQFSNFVEHTKQYFAYCRKTIADAGAAFLEVQYPDILQNAEIIKILQYLNVRTDHLRLSTPHQRQGNYSLHDIIGNYHELVQHIGSGPLAEYINNGFPET